uniref:Uncharacterized protein n=1 Tax=Anguilla anguilla TaxID=7936 RepID=A0A0E9W7P8_ANGAN
MDKNGWCLVCFRARFLNVGLDCEGNSNVVLPNRSNFSL